MQITYKDQLGFILKGNSVSVSLACDPKQVSSEEVVVTASADDAPKISKDQAVMDWAGEYESRGVSVMIIPTGKDQTGRVAKIMLDDTAIAHMTALTEPLSEAEEEKIGNIDILFVAVGQTAELNAKQIQQTIEAIDPRLVIPMNFAAGEQIDFAKSLGFSEVAEEDSLKIQKSGLANDRMDLRILVVK